MSKRRHQASSHLHRNFTHRTGKKKLRQQLRHRSLIDRLESRFLLSGITFPTQNQLGNVFQTGQTVQIPMSVATGDSVHWTATNFYGTQVAAGSAAVSGGTATVSPGITTLGWYDLQLAEYSSGNPVTGGTGETEFAIIPTETSATGRPSTGTQFGVQGHFANGWNTSVMPLISKAGMGYVRDEQWWQNVEPNGGGTYTFPSTFTNYMSALSTNGVSILQTADFANSNYDSGNTPDDSTGYNGFANYANALVGQYGSQIQTLEVWNEYNGTWCTGPATANRPQYYTNLLEATYNTVHAAHPGVTILGGAAVLTPLGYYDQMFKDGALNYMNGIVIHTYEAATPYTVEQEISALNALMMADAGKTVPIYVTETGLNPGTSAGIGQESMATYMDQLFTSEQSAGVKMISWYDLENNGGENTWLLSGPTDPMGAYVPNSAYVAYANYVNQMAGATFNQMWTTTDPRTRVYQFTNTGQSINIAYSTNGTTTLYLNTTAPLTVVDIMGNSTTYSPVNGVVTISGIGQNPLFIRGTVNSISETRPTVQLADSLHDYKYAINVSQDQNGWYYGYADNTNGAGGSYTDTTFTDDSWTLSDYGYSWTNSAQYNSISGGGQEPTSGRWAIRRWVSNTTGTVTATSLISLSGTGGDGVVFEIAVNGTQVASQTITSTTPTTYTTSLSLHSGDLVDFIVTSGAANNQNYDSTNLDVTLTTTPTSMNLGQIMPLGDSITDGVTTPVTAEAAGYRDPLFTDLNQAGFGFSFVGSESDNSTAELVAAGDQDHEGHPGYVIESTYNGQSSGRSGILDNITSYLPTGSGPQPNYILLQIGSNDVELQFQLSTAATRLGALIDAIAAQRPNANIIVAEITPLVDSTLDPLAVAYNYGVASTVLAHANSGEHVTLVDMHSALNPSTDISIDNLHPTLSGYQKMASVWLQGIEAVANPGSVPNSPSNLTATPVSSSQITLNWTNNASTETGFLVERKTGSGGTYAQIALVAENDTSFIDTGLSASTQYYYRIRAINALGDSAYSNETNATTTASGGGITDVATGGTATGSEGSPQYAFDQSFSTFWQAQHSTGYLEYQFGNGASYDVTQYKITNGPTTTQRDPKSWTFLGSNDGSTWTTLDTQTNQTFANVNTTNTYNISNSNSYKYYQLNITANNGNALLEVTELQLMASIGTTPAAPTGLSATAASPSQINLSWSSVSGATGYNLYRGTSAGGESGTPVNGGTPLTTTSYSDTGLNETTTYYYIVKAVNSNGSSGASNEANATTTQGTLPSAPTGLTATTASASQINLSWTSVSGATGYNVYRGTSSGGESSTPVNGGTPLTTTTYNDTGLSSSTAYYYVVKAVNANGSSGASNEANATTQSSGTLSNVATGGTATASEGSPQYAFDQNFSTLWQAQHQTGYLQYQFGSGASYDVTQYKITNGPTTTGRDPKNWTFKGSNDGSTWTTLDTQTNQTFTAINTTNTYSISNSNSYKYYQLNITANNGNPLLEVTELQLMAGTSIPSPAPTGLSASPASSTQINLTWNSVSGATGYNLYRGTSSGGENSNPINGATPLTTTSYSDTGLTAGTTYYYYVKAINSSGISAASTEASATTTGAAPGAPSSLTATAASSSQINLSWNSVSGATGYNLYRGTSAGGESTTAVNGGTPLTTTTYSDTGLSASATYYYVVKAVNSNGSSAASSEANAMTQGSGGLTDVATGGTATGSEGSPQYAFDGNFSTLWQAQHSTGVLQYQFGGGASYDVTQYKITNGPTTTGRDPKNWTFLGSNDGTTWTTLDTQTNQTFSAVNTTNTYNISNANSYKYYQLNVTANNGNPLLEVTELQLMAGTGSTPAAPTGLTASVISSSQVNLSWNSVSGATGYNLYRGTSSGGESSTPVNGGTPLTTTSYSDTGLSASTTYYYIVKAVNSSGSSGASNEATGTTSSHTLSNVTTGGTASGSEGTASYAFDGSNSTIWQAQHQTGWIEYQFGSGASYAVSEYKITNGFTTTGRDPAAWQLQGSNDGSTWTTVDSQSGQTFSGTSTTNTYTFTNSTSYKYYRLNITANNGNPLLEVAELQLWA
jgi:lysophospholipase L1-like esterase